MLRRAVPIACGLAFAAATYGPLLFSLSAFQLSGNAAPADLWARRLGLLWTSAQVAGLATAAAVLLGTPIGVLWARVRIPAPRLLLAACAGILVLPPYVFGIAWLAAFGAKGAWIPGAESLAGPAWDPYHGWVAGLVLAWALCPIVAFSTAACLLAVPAEREEWALLSAGPLRVLRRVTLPEARDGILLGAGIVFLLAWSDFAVPDLFRTRVYAAEVFTEFSAFFRLGPTLGGVVPLALGGAIVLGGMLLARAEAAQRASSRPPRRARLQPTGAGRALAWGAWAAVLALLFLPLVILLDRARPWRDSLTVWSSAAPELLLSLRTSALAAVFCGLVGWGCAGLLTPHPWRRRRWLEAIALFPLLVPAPLVGIGLIRLWNREGWMGAVYQHEGILVLAAAARFAPLAAVAWARGLARIPRALYDSAWLDGLSPWAWQRAVALPAAWRHGLAGMALVFALSMGELGASVLVAPPGTTPLSVRIFTLLHYGADRMVAALCVLVMVSIALPCLLAARALANAWRS